MELDKLPKGLVMSPRFDANVLVPGMAVRIHDGNNSFNNSYTYHAIITSVRHNVLNVAVYDRGEITCHTLELDRVLSEKITIVLLDDFE